MKLLQIQDNGHGIRVSTYLPLTFPYLHFYLLPLSRASNPVFGADLRSSPYVIRTESRPPTPRNPLRNVQALRLLRPLTAADLRLPWRGTCVHLARRAPLRDHEDKK
jgi:hypothetical protein